MNRPRASSIPRPVRALPILLVVLAFVGLSAGYALTTPRWNNPDEPAHYNYVAYIAQTGTLPIMQMGDWDEALLDQLISQQFPSADSVATLRYESWEPPLYYILAVPAYDAGHGSLPAQVRDLRLFDVALGALTILVAFALARELFVRAPVAAVASLARRDRFVLALATPLLLVGLPMFAAVSGAIDNDALADLLGALLSLALVRLLVRRPTWRAALFAGVLLAAALLTKATLVPFAALVPAALVAAGLRAGLSSRRTFGLAAVSLLCTFALLLPWLIRQGLTYGWNDVLATARHDQVVVNQPPGQGLSATYWEHWGMTSLHSFWGQFGWMTIVAPDRLYTFWGILSGLAALGAVVLAVRYGRSWAGALRRLDGRAPYPDLRPLFLAGAVLGCLAVDVYHNIGYDQAQGRFVYAALAPLAVFAVLGWGVFLPRVVRGPAVFLLTVMLVALNVYTLLRVVMPAWHPS